MLDDGFYNIKKMLNAKFIRYTIHFEYHDLDYNLDDLFVFPE